MGGIPDWLKIAVALIVGGLLVGWLGRALGRKAARRYPAMAGALWLLSTFLKVDPPPPPKAERITKSEEDAGAPPTV